MLASKEAPNVFRQINSWPAWQLSRGQSVHIAIVDTGINGAVAEFPDWKQARYCWPDQARAWQKSCHGTMVAAIAGANSAQGGRIDGVAPDATLISCCTTYQEEDLCAIYQYLINLVSFGLVNRLVINNSFGPRNGRYARISPGSPFLEMVRRAVACGIVVVFAAGNNHVLRCKYDPQASGPNSIYGAASLDEVITVGSVDEFNRMDRPPASGSGYSHRDSSRGPGELAQRSTKPDCVAPTFGGILLGHGYVNLEWWGTSGAAAQVAGLAALLLARHPTLSPEQIKTIIKKSCQPLPLPETCVGAGLIDCLAAIKLADDMK